jgi:hypothetical protein
MAQIVQKWAGSNIVGKLAGAAAIVLLSSTASMAQFHATLNDSGETVVLDESGVEVDIAPADPVGVRPSYCPAGSYYASEVPTDKTELVLADCVTSSLQFTVEMQGLLDPLSGED